MSRRRAVVAGALLACCAWIGPFAPFVPLAAAQAVQAPDAAEASALHALFDRVWEDEARRFPEEATLRGDLRYNDRWSDGSARAREAFEAQMRAWLAEARAIRRERLSPGDQVSLDLFAGRLERRLRERSFVGWRSLRIGALGGVQTELADFLQAVPVDTTGQAEQLLKRLADWPRSLQDEIDAMREGLAVGWVPTREVLDRAVRAIDEQLAAPVESGPWFEPFRRLGADIPASDAARLRAAGRATIEGRVVPAMRGLRAFIVDEYLPRAAADGALRNYPQGAQVYEMLVASRTTTRLTAQEVHAIGQRELASIRAEMEGVMRQVRFTGSFAQFVEYLNTDPKFFHASPEALLAGYRDIAKRIDAQLPRLFAELPRAPYGVRAMPAHRGPDAAEYYDAPALDGSRAGFFNANAVGFRTRPTWRMASLTAHEAVPGHHLQIARAMELRDLPRFRRRSGYIAFVEGWGVYAESLGREIGLYDDPYSLFGHLQWRAFRAARLVVDTGIHAQGWTRQQAIDYMVERTGMDRGFVTSEVDRYISDPGQALGYMIGALKFQELRERAKARLGSRFDVRRFHNAVLDNGALPLDVLERLVDDWIEAERKR